MLCRAPLTLAPADSCHLLCIQLTGQAPQQLLAGLTELPFLARGETCPAAAELLGRLAAEAEAPRSRAASQLAFALLCELSGADSAAPPLPPLVEAAIEDIRRNYAGLYGVEELSERLGVSKSHLVRTFTAAVGVPPGRYLTTVRVEAAMRLLLHREYTLDVIASLCGFSGANYLCRVFKKRPASPPRNGGLWPVRPCAPFRRRKAGGSRHFMFDFLPGPGCGPAAWRRTFPRPPWSPHPGCSSPGCRRGHSRWRPGADGGLPPALPRSVR